MASNVTKWETEDPIVQVYLVAHIEEFVAGQEEQSLGEDDWR